MGFSFAFVFQFVASEFLHWLRYTGCIFGDVTGTDSDRTAFEFVDIWPAKVICVPTFQSERAQFLMLHVSRSCFDEFFFSAGCPFSFPKSTLA